MNDEECVREIAAGGSDRETAIALLFDRYYKKFVSHLMFRRVARHDAEDIVQDVFVSIVKSLQGSKTEIQSTRAYLYRALHNRFVDHLRAKRPEIHESDMQGQNDQEDTSIIDRIADTLGFDEDDLGFLHCFEGALQRFFGKDEEAGTAIQMAVEGFSGQEIAEVLGRSHGATREFLRQCRRKFQALLKELCFDYLPEKLRAS